MKIAITATAATLDANVDPRFGRCPCFLIVETDSMDHEAIENPNMTLGGGAGIQSAQLMTEKGVKCVLTGNCGPNAHQTLSAADIQIIVGCSGAVRDVVEQFKAGQLNTTSEPNVASHFAMDPGYGRGKGMGRGRGRERGQGRGAGRGRDLSGDAVAEP